MTQSGKGWWKSLRNLCKEHRATSYFKLHDGTVGIYNHANRICWYRLQGAGWSLCGITDDTYGAVLCSVGNDKQRVLFR